MRTIIIGDIHGCADELEDLLALVNLKFDDRVICTGDLIVKGLHSRRVLKRFVEDKRFSSVVGNHDLGVLRFWQNPRDARVKKSQIKCAETLAANRKVFESYLTTLPRFIELDKHIIVHAGFRPGVELENQSLEDCTELRTLGADRTSRVGAAWYDYYRHPHRQIVFGHWASDDIRRPRTEPHTAIGIDTACVFGNRLTAYILESGELPCVNARRVYEQPKHRG